MPTADMGSELDAIQVFANSANSVRVFEALADGATSSSDLAEQTGASRSTVARILNNGESRGWIDSEGSQYELTNLGRIMIDEFRATLENVGAVQQLGAAINYLPGPARDLDYRHLRDAEITTPTSENPSAHIVRWIEVIRAADRYRGLNNIGPDVYMDALRECVEGGQLEVQAVLEAGFFDSLTDPGRAGPWRLLADGIRVYDGRVPLNMHIVDDRLLLWLAYVDGEEWDVYGLLESTHNAVLSWAESMYDEYWAASEPLDPAMLPDV